LKSAARTSSFPISAAMLPTVTANMDAPITWEPQQLNNTEVKDQNSRTFSDSDQKVRCCLARFIPQNSRTKPTEEDLGARCSAPRRALPHRDNKSKVGGRLEKGSKVTG